MRSRKNPDGLENKNLKPDFKPTTQTLIRILKTMMENGADQKTTLSVSTNLNYSRLAKHIVWLEQRGLVESKIDESEIKVKLTEKGKEFVSIFSDDLGL
jgi:predicted transcriptional regulator